MSPIAVPLFQSTRPLRGGTSVPDMDVCFEFISIHPPLAGRDDTASLVEILRDISIHPPLAGRDLDYLVVVFETLISIHPPLAGRDEIADVEIMLEQIFQSTRPLRGGTPADKRNVVIQVFQSTRPLRGGTMVRFPPNSFPTYFNPPAPCGAGLLCSWAVAPPITFQSTRPLRGGTLRKVPSRRLHRFQSTRPLRGGTSTGSLPLKSRLFQSTRPLRGGTAILHKKTVQNIAYCTKSAFTLAVLSGFLALMRPFFLPNVHKFRCEPSEESLLAPRSHAYTIRTPSG